MDLAFYPQINEFRSRRSVQLLVLDIRRADHCESCRRILQGGSAEPARISRGELGRLWRALEGQCSPACCTLRSLPSLEPRLHPAKIALGLRVFRELDLASVVFVEERIEIMLTNSADKAQLDDSPSWRRYCSQGNKI